MAPPPSTRGKNDRNGARSKDARGDFLELEAILSKSTCCASTSPLPDPSDNNLPPAHFQNPPSFPTSPSDWRKANQKKREFLFKVQKTAKCKGQQTKGKAGEMESIIKLHKNSYNLWNSSLNNPEIRKLLKGRNQPSANLLLSNGKPACFFSPGMASFDMKRFEKFTLWGLLKRGPVPWGEGGASH